MHVYKGYKYDAYKGDGYGAGQRQVQATTREELERQYAESLAGSTSSGAPKPRRNLLPFIVTGLSSLVAIICIGAWMLGYDLVVPMLAMDTVLLGGYVGWRMM